MSPSRPDPTEPPWAPAGKPSAPASEPAPVPGDAGVPQRVRTRTAIAAGVPATVGGLLALFGWGWPGWFRGPAGLVIGLCAVGACAATAAVLFRRAVLWGHAMRLSARLTQAQPGDVADPARPLSGGGTGDSTDIRPRGTRSVDRLPAVCGAAVPLHRLRPGTTRLLTGRRLRTHVMPLRTVSGVLADGDAVLLHPRLDASLPRPEDRIEVHPLGLRGPFLLLRPEDGAIFAADRWLFSAL